MTALDTNVLVRFLSQDEDTQFRKVLQMLNRKRATFFVCDLVLAETDWVLRSLYAWSGEEVADAFARLAQAPVAAPPPLAKPEPPRFVLGVRPSAPLSEEITGEDEAPETDDVAPPRPDIRAQPIEMEEALINPEPPTTRISLRDLADDLIVPAPLPAPAKTKLGPRTLKRSDSAVDSEPTDD